MIALVGVVLAIVGVARARWLDQNQNFGVAAPFLAKSGIDSASASVWSSSPVSRQSRSIATSPRQF